MHGVMTSFSRAGPMSACGCSKQQSRAYNMGSGFWS